VNEPTGVPVRRWLRLGPDPSRVITMMFVPGQEGFERQDSRTAAVLARVLALDEQEAQSALDDVVARFDGRHRDLLGVFRHHASEVADRLQPDYELTEARRLLLGATFTSEYAIEGAALCNPSMVAHPDQSDVSVDGLRFVMSARAIGEGHRSSIGFRTGTIDATGHPTLDPPPLFATAGTIEPAPLEAVTFQSELNRFDSDGQDADYILHALGQRFTHTDLNERLEKLQVNLTTRQGATRTTEVIKAIAERSYAVAFSDDTPLAERVLWPAVGAESHGMEDARFARFVDDDGCVTNYATYTAYDGANIVQQLLETADFETFTSSPIVGAAATNKGLALFPRRIHGRFAALSRWDRDKNSVAFSDNPRHWPSATPCQTPSRAWEMVQLGNCGSPIETDAGWLVLTHGVGPMRTYSIGAVLLDLDDPTIVLSQLPHPLLTPNVDEQDGYVPNVVYSCGALVHADTLVLPYGIGDAAIGVASVPMPDLLAALDRSRKR
jgi:predicted GH43/DUF377 family glycosyl hydrolase